MLEHEIYDWLQSRGIDTARYNIFKIDDELEADSYPAVLKIASPKVAHKSDVGGVITDIDCREKLIAAKGVILCNLEKKGIHPDDKDHLLVAEQCKGIELFFGIVNDPAFEKVIAFGAGGIFTELFRDICFIDSEADEEEIKRAISKTKISTLFTKGFRGKKFDINIIVDFVKKIQQLDADELDLNPVMLSDNKLTVVDARLLPAHQKSPGKSTKFQPEIFRPGKIAVIGVSEHADKVGYALAKSTSLNPNVYFVNPKLNTLFNKKVFHSIDDLPQIDTAVLAIPAAAIREAIEKLVLKNVKNIIIITAGFKETGNDEKFLSNIAAMHNINIIGPNCLGAYLNGVNLTFGTSHIRDGAVNLFSQSGAIIAELMDKAALKMFGFENIISVGNMADIDFADLINSYKGNKPINMYVEGIANGKNFLRAIRKSRVPINIFKSGKSEVAKKAAFSHTGNMAGNYEMFINLAENAGAKILHDINGLLYPYNFRKILVITNAGGAGTVLSDLISDKLYSLNQAEINQLSAVLPCHWSKNNPIDIVGDAGSDRYEAALEIADEFGADAIYVIITPQFMTDAEKIMDVFIDGRFKTKIFPILLGGEMMKAAKNKLQKNKIIYFEEIDEAVSFL